MPSSLLLSALLLVSTFVVTQITVDARECHQKSCYRYYNKKTAPYFVDQWPLYDLPTGEFYSGNVVVDEADPSRSLFFVFKPASNGQVNETTIWLNGGPGCSSLIGFLQENGPILWQPGTLEPTTNPYAWSTITNMLWVESVDTATQVRDCPELTEIQIPSRSWLHYWEDHSSHGG